ncbi:PIG-L family deacetylase [Aeoliella sp. SH292]|uniref:PIG-L family deacetylase n=1 Tax=Aeoliella sp. SH292 TaxID=3454464 RepID=UPI003F99DB41
MTDLSIEPLDVIAVGAHPDDVEIGCGGSLAKLVEQGYRVGIIDLTDGEPTPLSPSPEVRAAEAEVAAEELGVHHRATLDLANRRLMDTFEARVTLAKEFRRWRPRLVLSLGDRTPTASPDHWQALVITEAAVFYSRLTKWDDQFDHLPPHKIDALLYYSLNFYSLDPPPGHSFVVDIGSTYDKKIAAVRSYATQFPAEKQHIFARLDAMSLYFGEAAGFERGERLASPRAVGVRDLMGQLF